MPLTVPLLSERNLMRKRRTDTTMKRATIAILLLALLTGCSKTLTRGKAKDLISEHHHYDQAVPVKIDPTDDELIEGQKRGLWKLYRGGLFTTHLAHELTPYGKQFFTFSQECRCTTTIATAHPVIEITGIKGEGSTREVEYTIQWFTDVPGEVKDLFKSHAPEQGKDDLQLYDDGWRVVR